MKNYVLPIILMGILASCSTSNSVSSNRIIQKKKYSKGFTHFKPIKSHSKSVDEDTEQFSYVAYHTNSSTFKAKAAEITNEKLDNNASITKTSETGTELLIKMNDDTFIEECDSVILKSGVEIAVKIIEISDKVVKYKKCNFLEGPLYSLNPKNIYKIKYSNGEEEFFDKVSEPSNSNSNTNSNSSEKKYEVYSIISSAMVLASLLGLVFLAPVAVIFAIIGLKRINKSDSLKGKGFAIAGLIGGLLVTLLVTVALISISSCLFYC